MTWQQLTRSENCTNQIAELSTSHSSWYESTSEIVSRQFELFFFLLHWIEKWSSRGHLVEHLKSSGTKIMTRGSVVRQL